MFATNDFDLAQTDIGLWHNNFNRRGQVIQWSGSDTKTSFDNHCKDPVKKNLLEQLGWLEPNCITYQFNSFGFRDEEFDSRPCGLALGCSFTEGTGLPEHLVWPRVLSKMVGLHIWNLGVAGSSIDTTFRLLDFWLKRLTPKLVVLCIPPDQRIEVFDQHKPVTLMPGVNPHVEPYKSYYKMWTSNNANAIIDKRKNLLAMQQLCNQLQIPFVSLDYTMMIPQGTARDLAHHGAESHQDFAQQLYKLLPKDLT